jgi:geranylgeranyl diphosphate synthase type II
LKNNLINEYRNKIDNKLGDFLKSQTLRSFYSDNKYPDSLFDPLNYIMSGGGKRIRPLILLLSCEAFGGNINSALDAAIAVEILHNFTLVHDDIMDNAETRRGKTTVHKKWSVNTAILVGDELIGLSYRSLLNTNTLRFDEIVKAFTDGVIEVCEGQALDNQFEKKDNVFLDDYMVMIRKKTAELLRTSAIIGALIAKSDDRVIDSISTYAVNLGLAFQIQDDLLDVVANENEFGKKIGGDILEKKKTFLFLKSLEISVEEIKNKLLKLYFSDNNFNQIEEIFNIYKELGVIELAKKEIEKYTDVANKSILDLENERASSLLQNFSVMLLNREY